MCVSIGAAVAKVEPPHGGGLGATVAPILEERHLVCTLLVTWQHETQQYTSRRIYGDVECRTYAKSNTDWAVSQHETEAIYLEASNATM